jgi:tRNA pseudouridine65 synthase
MVPILFQDDSMIAVYKPAGMIVHRVSGTETESIALLQTVRDQIGQRIFPVHRLDQPTAGIVLFGLDNTQAAFLVDQFTQRRVVKCYQALVWGNLSKRMLLDNPLPKDENENRHHLVDAFTIVEPIARGEIAIDSTSKQPVTLVELTPKTGRWHQLRRHLAAAGFPIVGDRRHGNEALDNSLKSVNTQERMMLVAAYIRCHHPERNSQLELRADCDQEYQSIVTQACLSRCS